MPTFDASHAIWQGSENVRLVLNQTLRDVAAVGEAVEQGCGHLCVAEHCGPFAEAEVGGDDDAGALVKLAEAVEEQGAA